MLKFIYMASWGTRRRNFIIFLFLLVVLIFSAIFAFVSYYEEPTCFDGKQNGDEEGIDCGGSCLLLCDHQVVQPIVQWRRFFEIGPGYYNVIAYVENKNPDAGASNARYLFKLYDSDGVILTEREGMIHLKPNQIIPIVENNLNTGQLKASRVSFEFTNKLVWIKKEPIRNLVSIRNQNIIEADGLPRATATVYNNTLVALKDIKLVAIIYDFQGNAIATSNTIVFRLEKDQNQNIIFTWPTPLPTPASRIEIIPIYDLNY